MIAASMIQNLFASKTMAGSSKAGKTGAGKGDAASAFAMLMGKHQSTGKSGGRNLLQAASARLRGQISDAGIKGTPGKATPGLTKLTGHALLAQLKQQLQSAGIPLDQVVADDKALASLEKLLVGAGFDPDQVKSMLGELKTNAGAKGVRLTALFDGISRLDEETPEEYGPEYLAISTLPYLETILAQLGLSAEQTAGILANAKIEGQGIDVMRLAAGLKQLQPGAGSRSKMLPVAGGNSKIIPLTGNRQQTLAMLQRIGLISGEGRAENVDLDGLIMALEKRGARTSLLPDAGGQAVETARAPVADQKPYPGPLSNRAESGALGADGGPVRSLRFSSGAAGPAMDRVMANPAAVGSAPLSNGLSGAWDGFLQNIKEISGNNKTGDNKKGTLADGRTVTRKFSKANAGRSNASLETKGASGPHAGNNAPTDSELNRPAERAINTLAAPAGSVGQPGDALEKGGMAAGARTDNQGFGSLLGSSEAGMKSDDPATIFTDGLTRRPAVAESAGDASPRPAARTVPTYMLEQVSRQILRSRLLGENEIRLQLKPPSLGRLKMSIENTTNGLKVSIIAESPVARDMLMAHSNDLRNSLMGQGMQVDKIDVETQADFSQNMADAHQGSNRPGGRSRLSGASGSRPDAETDAVANEPAEAMENNDGVLNLVA